MDVTPDRIQSLVEEVRRELGSKGAVRTRPGGYGAGFAGSAGSAGSGAPSAPRRDPAGTRENAGPKSRAGLVPDLESAIRLVADGHRRLVELPLETRAACIASIRAKLRANVRLLSELAVSETGMGRVDDKIQKNLLVIERTPGLEDLEPLAVTGDHGLTLTEWAPYGIIGAAGPSTNPSETVINNGIGMIAGGNAVVFAAHPTAKRTCATTVALINEAVQEAGGPACVMAMVEEPTIESAQAMMRHKEVRLLVVTGGPGVVREAMNSGKKVIAAGPGNPPVVVDETADLVAAGRDIVRGASLDNNIICTDEKEVFVVEAAAETLFASMQRHGAYLAKATEADALRRLLLQEDRGPRRHSVVNRKWVGKDAAVILREIGVSVGPEVRLIACDVPPDHPFVWTELLLPVLGVARVPSAEEGMEWAVAAEHGFRHTASIHSRNIERLSHMARLMNCSIFIKNGPNFAGLGMGGEGPTSFTIASPTGEGMTTARTFTRRRRCTLVDYFRIV
jgi:aldehyde dehydrogenase